MTDPITQRTFASLRRAVLQLLLDVTSLEPGHTVQDESHIGTNVSVLVQRGQLPAPPGYIGLWAPDAIELVLAIEQTFGIHITLEEEASVATFGQLVDLVASKAGIAKEAA